MAKLRKICQLVVEGGIRAIISLVIAEGVFLGLAFVAGIVGAIFGDWKSGMIAAVAALILLNALAMEEAFSWIYPKLDRTEKFPSTKE